MDIKAEDCSLYGASCEAGTVWIRGVHLPTGVSVTVHHGPLAEGLAGKRRLMNRLQTEVDEYLDNELSKL